MPRFILLALCSLTVVASSSCGGAKGASSGDGTTAVDKSGKKVTRGDGTAVNVEAHNYWMKGVAAYKLGEAKGWNDDRCDKAAGKFEDAADSQDKFAEALYMTGRSHQACGRDDKAGSWYQKALRANSKFCKARVAIGIGHLKKRNVSAANREFAGALRNDAQCTEAYVNIAVMSRRAQGVAANKEALSNLRRALAIDARYLPAFNEMALLYLSEAEDNPKALDLAEVVCSQAQKIDKNYAPIYNTWGLIDLKRDKIIDAASKFQRAFQLDTKMFEAYMNFAQITIGFRGYEDAKVAFTKALKLQPKNFDALLGLGVAYRGLEQNDKAIANYDKAKALKPSRPEPYYNTGIIHQDFMDATAKEMNTAKGFYDQFLSRVKGGQYSRVVKEIKDKCTVGKGGKRKRRDKCISGRFQNIALFKQAMKEMKEMSVLQKKSAIALKKMQAEEKRQLAAEKIRLAAEKKAADEAARKKEEKRLAREKWIKENPEEYAAEQKAIADKKAADEKRIEDAKKAKAERKRKAAKAKAKKKKAQSNEALFGN